MNLVRFIGLLFVFIGVLASCAVAVALLVLMLRFWPVLLAVALVCGVFGRVLKRMGYS
jgi:hypothetical protein